MNIPKMRQEAAKTMKHYELILSDVMDIKEIAGTDWVDAAMIDYEIGFVRGRRAEKRRRKRGVLNGKEFL